MFTTVVLFIGENGERMSIVCVSQSFCSQVLAKDFRGTWDQWALRLRNRCCLHVLFQPSGAVCYSETKTVESGNKPLQSIHKYVSTFDAWFSFVSQQSMRTKLQPPPGTYIALTTLSYSSSNARFISSWMSLMLASFTRAYRIFIRIRSFPSFISFSASTPRCRAYDCSLWYTSRSLTQPRCRASLAR